MRRIFGKLPLPCVVSSSPWETAIHWTEHAQGQVCPAAIGISYCHAKWVLVLHSREICPWVRTRLHSSHTRHPPWLRGFRQWLMSDSESQSPVMHIALYQKKSTDIHHRRNWCSLPFPTCVANSAAPSPAPSFLRSAHRALLPSTLSPPHCQAPSYPSALPVAPHTGMLITISVPSKTLWWLGLSLQVLPI